MYIQYETKNNKLIANHFHQDGNGSLVLDDYYSYECKKPEIYFKIEKDAVLIFTPTKLTIFSTVNFKELSKSLELTSYWYNPTPIPLGSILTNSDKASCILLPIDIADLCDTSRLGNSLIAKLEAE